MFTDCFMTQEDWKKNLKVLQALDFLKSSKDLTEQKVMIPRYTDTQFRI